MTQWMREKLPGSREQLAGLECLDRIRPRQMFDYLSTV
jgi:hypothetical protein